MDERCSAATLDLLDPLETLVERIPAIHVEEVVVFLVKDVCVAVSAGSHARSRDEGMQDDG